MKSRVPPPGPEREAWKKKNARFGSPLMVIALKEGWKAPVLDGEERHDLLPDEAFVDGVNPYFEDKERRVTETESLSNNAALPDDVVEFLEECSDEVAELIRNSEAFKKWKRQDSDPVDENTPGN